ncbi:pyridoxal-phosphate dependent enzyme [Notoacmeibacter sp. MSK16QG-6]|uniref:threonine synthase n=1 Tax=Notoacmeibacter sp. MSK16QG-6 TaxID=2957982 RepID=UPI00209E5AE5|nr:pyridoxal-phosphate dependent enzyme [Notoacmeibacter sp. MSK16QG-6]MCP1200533.1 pyridoxal-phosphate dependent enzyme [Notoacmeibacter sp. MSK16QG-6]
MNLHFETRSLATVQRSLAADAKDYPLLPALLSGCPASATEAMQYPLELDYDYGSVRDATFRRGSTWTDWEELLPPRHPRADMPVGGTPLVDVSTLAPAHLADRRILMKDESRNPTWSHKDRLNIFTVSAALFEGAKTIIVASSGNHGVSAAAMAARGGLNCVVLTMPDVSGAFRDMLFGYGAFPVFLKADDRWPAMRALSELPGMYPVSNLTPAHTGHPWGPEGYKTIAYEILADLDGVAPAAIVVPTGYGEMLYGIYKGFREARLLGHIDRLPQLVAVEPAARGPVHHALEQGKMTVTVAPGPTIQLGTATTVNGYRPIAALHESDGLSLLVDDEAAQTAHRRLAGQGLWQEVSSGASLAALDQIEGFETEGPIVLMGCSTGLKEPNEPMQFKASGADLQDLKAVLERDYGFKI